MKNFIDMVNMISMDVIMITTYECLHWAYYLQSYMHVKYMRVHMHQHVMKSPCAPSAAPFTKID